MSSRAPIVSSRLLMSVVVGSVLLIIVASITITMSTDRNRAGARGPEQSLSTATSPATTTQPPTSIPPSTTTTTQVAVIRAQAAPLTPDGDDQYLYEPGRGSMVVRAPATNEGGNLRDVWWPMNATATVDHESCATWTEFGGPIAQAGVALRVRRQGGAVQAITVTNNIWWGARSGWNVHAWPADGGPTLVVGQRLLGIPSLPWRLCARAVGSMVDFKVWSLADGGSEPAWGDPVFGASFELLPEWVYVGQPGWYTGHLRRGEALSFDSLRARALP